MGQDLSQFTENVPSLVKDTLRRIGQEVAMDLHENSVATLVDNGDDDVKQEEEMAMTSPLYFGIWQDNEGRAFYYDVQHGAYFFLEQRHSVPSSDIIASPPTQIIKEGISTTTTNIIKKDDNNNNKEDCLSSSNTRGTTTAMVPRPVSKISVITNKIMTDLQIIYSNVTNSVSMLLDRGEGIEQTRQKLNEMMDTASSLERQSRCLSCAHRCNAIWPGSGFFFILKIADMIPMSACCQDDGVCGPYVFMSEDEDSDVDEFEDGGGGGIVRSKLVDHHLE